jgi:hypothetical protein
MFDDGTTFTLSKSSRHFLKKLIVSDPCRTLSNMYICYEKAIDFKKRYSKENLQNIASFIIINKIVNPNEINNK